MCRTQITGSLIEKIFRNGGYLGNRTRDLRKISIPFSYYKYVKFKRLNFF